MYLYKSETSQINPSPFTGKMKYSSLFQLFPKLHWISSINTKTRHLQERLLNSELNKIQKKELRNFILKFDEVDMLSVTLSLKQRHFVEKIDRIKAQTNFRHFMNRLNRKRFGNLFSRYKKRLRVVPSLETSYSGRLHYHVFLEDPFPEDLERSKSIIDECWSKTKFGYSDNLIVRTFSQKGWLDYISKQGLESMDFENFHLRK